MPYVSKSAEEIDAIVCQLDSLEDLVVETFLPWCQVEFQGWEFQSRYAYVSNSSGSYAVKIRVADHANQSRDSDNTSAHVNLVVGREYTKNQIWRLVIDAIEKAI